MRNRIARAAVVVAMAGTFAVGAGAAFAGNPGAGVKTPLDSKVRDGKVVDVADAVDKPPADAPKPGGDADKDDKAEGSKVVDKGDYPYEVPGDDGKYELDEKMCWEALKHPEPPHQDGDRASYWKACHHKYGDYHEPKKYDTKTTTWKTQAPSVHVSPTFAG